jgi:hypothetical protein
LDSNHLPIRSEVTCTNKYIQCPNSSLSGERARERKKERERRKYSPLDFFFLLFPPLSCLPPSLPVLPLFISYLLLFPLPLLYTSLLLLLLLLLLLFLLLLVLIFSPYQRSILISYTLVAP